MPRNYLIVAPCRNEAKFVRRTLDSVAAQSERPALMIVVDDGSTDATPQILADYAAKYDWIKIVRREDRGKRSVGPGVIEAFYAGLESVDSDSFDYLCKLDLDLELPVRYFQRLMDAMDKKPRLGSWSGKAYFPGPSNPDGHIDGELINEGIGDEVSVGASKFYRTTCFQQIGGFVRQVMWDGIDCHTARLLGWQVGSSDDPELRFVHLRPMGSSTGSIWEGRKRHGRGQYMMGTGVTFMLASAARRLLSYPAFTGSIAIVVGYVEALVSGQPRHGDSSFRKLLTRYQWESLVMGKTRAARRVEKRRAEFWNPDLLRREPLGQVQG